MRGRRRLLLVLVPLLALGVWAAVRVRRAVEARAEAALRRAGLTARTVRFSWLGPLRLEQVEGGVPGGGRLAIDTALLRFSVLGTHEPRTHLARVVLRGLRLERPPLAAVWPEADLDVVTWRHEGGVERLTLRQHAGEGTIEVSGSAAEAGAELTLTQLDLGTAEVLWNGDRVLSPGRWSGRATFAGSAVRFESGGTFHGDAVRLTPASPVPADDEGAPTAMDVAWTLHGRGDTIEVGRFAARLPGLDVNARGVVRTTPDRHVDVALTARCELADALRTAGLVLPLKGAGAGRLGAADLELAMRGPLAEPGALVIDPRLRFTPEPALEAAFSYLRAPFVYRPDVSPGMEVDVRDGAPDFIAIDAVPALFQRALIVSEDAGFPRHCGIDLAEIAAAWAENEEEGRRLRGASTITQQLVKNLLLSSEKTYGRKLKEAALALMVDAAVPKSRLLEIYVNIIEWGPRLHGLVPAARHYFDKRPDELTPKETAFLVCLIPAPVRYHQAHEAGRIGPGMEQLVHNLLAKLHALGELDDDAYQRALDEELQFAAETAPT
jgi:penicillin-binding protein 1A